ncbi:MAG: NHLP family bacteriocin export ABC transporter peptidase/permease/ATPase subunit [Terriglobales bacterium]
MHSKRPGRRVSTPTILQMEAVECGAASLAIILAYFGRWVPLSELRRACGVSRDGSQATHILEAARSYGLTANAYATELENLAEIPCPFVVFWNFNHYLVVEGWDGDRAFLNDPGTGPRVVSRTEFSESYTGVLLQFEPNESFQKGGPRRRAWHGLRSRLQGSRGALAYCAILGLLLVLPGLAIPVLSQVFIDHVLLQRARSWVEPLVIGLIATALLRGICTLWQLKFLRALRIKLSVVLSSRFMWLVLRLPVSFYSQRFAGEISSRVRLNNDVSEVLSGHLATSAIDLVMIVFYGVAMFLYAPPLALIGIAAAAANLWALHWISRRQTDANHRLLREQGKVDGFSIAGLQSIETLKASGLENDFFTRWSGMYAKAVNAQQDLSVSSQLLGLIPSLVGALTSALVLVIGGLLVMEGHFTIGMLVAFQSLMQSFQQPLRSLVGLGSTLQQLQGDLNRLDDVEQEKEDELARDVRQGATPAVVPLEGHVELRNVTFGYNRFSAPVIQNLTVRLRPGQRVAFVGPSGSGKSTIAKLVCGLYQPWTGEVLFDGQPRTQVPRPLICQAAAMVEQDIFLFEGTVRENLTLWSSIISDDDLLQACRDACIEDTVLSLPGGLDAHLEEGGRNLSGGQRQRLEIARALVQNPRILVLDEATSALDAETERRIDQNLRRRGCTCIIVAHRLSTIRDCDEIVVLGRKGIAERGTHYQLMGGRGPYSELIALEGEALVEGAGA